MPDERAAPQAASDAAVRVRLAQVEDAALLARLGASTFAETFAPDNTDADIRGYVTAHFRTELQARELADAGVRYLIAEADRKPPDSKGARSREAAGYAKLRWAEAPECVRGRQPIEIERIYASRAHQGRGVGAALMNACIRLADELGAQTVWLGVWERNRKAIDFYRRFGFVECGDHIFTLGSDPQRDIVMSRPVRGER